MACNDSNLKVYAWSDGGRCKKILDLAAYIQNIVNQTISTDVWQEILINIPVPVSVVTSDYLKNEISSVITLNNTPIQWAQAGITHDAIAGTLTFPEDMGEVSGDISFWYKPS